MIAEKIAEKIASVSELTSRLEQARASERQAAVVAEDAQKRRDELAAAERGLTGRLVELARLLETQAEVIFGLAVSHYATGIMAPIAAETLGRLDPLVRERDLLSRVHTALIFRMHEAVLLSQFAAAEAQYRKGKVLEVTGALEQSLFYQRMAGAGLGPGVVEVHQAPHLETMRSGNAAVLGALRVCDDARQRLTEYQQKNQDNLRFSLP